MIKVKVRKSTELLPGLKAALDEKCITLYGFGWQYSEELGMCVYAETNVYKPPAERKKRKLIIKV